MYLIWMQQQQVFKNFILSMISPEQITVQGFLFKREALASQYVLRLYNLKGIRYMTQCTNLL